MNRMDAARDGVNDHMEEFTLPESAAMVVPEDFNWFCMLNDFRAPKASKCCGRLMRMLWQPYRDQPAAPRASLYCSGRMDLSQALGHFFVNIFSGNSPRVLQCPGLMLFRRE